MFALYITHPQVRIDPDVPVPQWGLSEVGAARAREAATRPWARQLGRIVSSGERKAIETAEILAAECGVPIDIVEAMHENDRSATGFLAPPDFENAADWFFANPYQSFKGWERAIDAQMRIISNVEAALSRHDPQIPIAFVGHGGVGTLLKCHLEDKPIARQGDQPPGGGNLFCFDLANRAISCDWTPIEDWKGWA
ncbi:histidine phosphatase family protein [Rhizobium sp. P38BS-XIX]|uniref:histidine phosphatase family protein n=1 Tax=Rhizobium sp. P38BS-XIX TaxID=2726740 RepID=UPI001457829A|nr:histidine phosphatase family protein [Rhizobium sp. P38BS-XIX]NLR98684.1 histidine phosphatase family protein [Rhizobium sp. P38BS-XIX]